MSKIQVTVEVSKETYEGAQAISQMVKDVKEALADGWQPGSDIPAIIQSSIKNVGEAVEGVTNAGEELAEDKTAFANAVALGVTEALGAF